MTLCVLLSHAQISYKLLLSSNKNDKNCLPSIMYHALLMISADDEILIAHSYFFCYKNQKNAKKSLREPIVNCPIIP